MGTIWSGRRSVASEELEARAARAAGGFAAAGIGRGDTVASCLRNDFVHLEMNIAAGLLGAYPVLLSWHSAPDEIAYMLRDCGAKIFVTHADILARIAGEIPEGVRVFAVETPPEIRAAYGIGELEAAVPQGCTDFELWRDAQSPLARPAEAAPGAIIYTSGTTGRPKGVRRLPPTPQQARASAARLAKVFGLVRNGPTDRLATVVSGPMYHSSPNTHAMIALRLGGDIVLQPKFDAEELLGLIERHRVTHLHLVPIMLNRLLKLPDEVRGRFDLSSLQYVVHTAAPVSPPIKRAMIEWWGQLIHEYYGTSETSILTVCLAEDWLAHPGSVGKPLEDVEVRILDGAGRQLPQGEVGEIVARVTSIPDFTYHGDDEKRRASDRDGFFAPGDIGYLDPDGFLYICDRAKDMVISGGVNIYPAEIEAQLQKMPGVADCVVFGVPDEEFGESLCAIVEPQAGAAADPSDIRAFLAARIAKYKVPRRIEFRSGLPREDSGKIRKRLLRDEFWKDAERSI